MEKVAIQKEVLEKALESVLDGAKIPLRTHLTALKALQSRVEAHDKTNEETKKIVETHKRQQQEWDERGKKTDAQIEEHRREVERLKTIARGEKGDKGDSIKGEPGKDGEDGKSVDLQDVVSAVLPLIPRPQKSKDGITPDMDKIIEGVIEVIKKKKPLDLSHIRNAQSFLKDGVRYKFEELMRGGGSSGTSTTVIVNEVVDGSGTTWTLAHTPTTNTLALYANGQRLTPTIDYSLSGAIITTVSSWVTGTILADYEY